MRTLKFSDWPQEIYACHAAGIVTAAHADWHLGNKHTRISFMQVRTVARSFKKIAMTRRCNKHLGRCFRSKSTTTCRSLPDFSAHVHVSHLAHGTHVKLAASPAPVVLFIFEPADFGGKRHQGSKARSSGSFWSSHS